VTPLAAARLSNTRYTLLALLFSLLWASGFSAMKIALRDAPPVTLMASRFLIAGTGLLALAYAQGATFPAGWRQWRPIALLGFLNHALYLGITATLLLWMSAGMGAVLASTNPLVLALVAPRALGEPLTRRKAIGLGLSFLGVVAMMWHRMGSDNHPLAMLGWLGCMAFLVAGTILFKRWRLPHDLSVINGGGLLVAGCLLTIPALLLESPAQIRLTAGLVLAQAWLVGVISMGAMVLWLWLLAHGDATRASAWWFLNPVLGLYLAALVLGEPLGPGDLGWAIVIATGIYLVQRGARSRPAAR
jgi:drug/metabolite transporter (DMT)-like permease